MATIDADGKIGVMKYFTMEDIQNLLCCAFEGGSNYWYIIEEFHKPTEFLHYADKDVSEKNRQIYRHLDYPVNPGGYIVVSDARLIEDEGGDESDCTKTKIDIEALNKGLQIMSNLYPWHFANVGTPKEDAETGDVFLQCCVFGKLVYG